MSMAQQINLFDPALQRQRDWLALGKVVPVAIVLALLVAGAGLLARQPLPMLQAQKAANDNQLKALRDRIVVLGRQATDRKPDSRVESELAETRRLAAVRGEVLQMLTQRLDARANPFADYLHGLARQSLPGLWITAFAFDAESGGMEIRGRTTDPALLPEYIRRLNKEPAFQGRAFSALKLAEGKPEQPAAKSPQATAPAAAPGAPTAKALFHEFVLIPVKTGPAQAGGKQG